MSGGVYTSLDAVLKIAQNHIIKERAMPEQLTKEELEQAKELVATREKQSAFWHRQRWHILLAGCFMLCMALVGFMIGYPLLHKIDSTTEDLAKTATLLDVRYATTMAMVFLALTLLPMFFAYMGISLIIPTLAKWNKHKDDALLAKLLKIQLQKDYDIDAPAPEAPSGNKYILSPIDLCENIAKIQKTPNTSAVIFLMITCVFAALGSVLTYNMPHVSPAFAAYAGNLNVPNIPGQIVADIVTFAALTITLVLLRKKNFLAKGFLKTTLKLPAEIFKDTKAAAIKFLQTLPITIPLWVVVVFLSKYVMKSVHGEYEWYGAAVVIMGIAINLFIWLLAATAPAPKLPPQD